MEIVRDMEILRDMGIVWFLVVIVLLAILIKAATRRGTGQGKLKPRLSRSRSTVFNANQCLLTENEKKMFFCLQKTLSKGYYVHCQVALLRLIKPSDFSGHRQIGAKHMDFVITDRQVNIQAVIELDDRSHNSPKRRKRDDFVECALKGNHTLVRFRTQRYYQPEEIAERLEKEAGIPNRFKRQPP